MVDIKEKIRMANPVLGPKELEYATAAISSGWISSMGEYVTKFEEKFSEYCGAKYGVAASSGTTAIHLALATLGIGPEDEVIIPTLTMIATANCVTYTGAKAVLADSENETWNMDVTRIERSITRKTKAIIVVHIYGHPVDMDPLVKIAKDHGIYVVEDAAEAHGAEYKGRKAGSLGDIGCFSFYANKIATTGEGGMLVTDNEEFAQRARMLRDQAFEKGKRFWHRYLGFNYRMTNVQAAIGLAQVERLEEFVGIRRRNAYYYNSLLKEVPGVALPPEAPWAKNVYWMYSILIDDVFGISRDNLMRFLDEQGVESRPFFYPIHTQPLYEKNYRGQSYPNAEGLSKRGLNLPSGNDLKKEQIERVVETIIAAKSSGR